MRLRMQPKFVTVDKMAGIFTKHIWQPYSVVPLLKGQGGNATALRRPCLPLLAVTVSLHYPVPAQTSEFNSHMRQNANIVT